VLVWKPGTIFSRSPCLLWSRIYRKRGVPAAEVRATIAAAENGCLRQCLYRTWADEKARELSGDDTGKVRTHAT